MSWRQVDELLAAFVAEGDPPAAQCAVRLHGELVFDASHGCSDASVFDLASVTKVAATTTLVAKLVAEGAVGLDDPIGEHLPALSGPPMTRTVRELLAHRGGLVPWRPFFAAPRATSAIEAVMRAGRFGVVDLDPAWSEARADVLRMVAAEPLADDGPTPRRAYSDLGFILLGALVEAATSAPLDAALRSIAPDDLGYVDLSAEARWIDGRRVLPTGSLRPREPAPGQEFAYLVSPQFPGERPGEVDDDNAFALGGVAGHAGVFGTARALTKHIHDVWIADTLGLGSARDAFLEVDHAAGPPRALGFDLPTPGSTAGRLAERAARAGRRFVGHLGFTGTSVWLDVDRGLSVALLTNRTRHGRDRVSGIRALRPAFHDAVHRALRGPSVS